MENTLMQQPSHIYLSIYLHHVHLLTAAPRPRVPQLLLASLGSSQHVGTRGAQSGRQVIIVITDNKVVINSSCCCMQVYLLLLCQSGGLRQAFHRRGCVLQSVGPLHRHGRPYSGAQLELCCLLHRPLLLQGPSDRQTLPALER